MNIAQRLRSIVGNGSMGIVLEPEQTRLLSDAADSIEMLGESNDKLKAQNSDFRELCKGMYRCILNRSDQEEIGYFRKELKRNGIEVS